MEEDVKHIRKTLDEILEVLKKPEHIIIRVLNFIAATVTIGGVVFIIEHYR